MELGTLSGTREQYSDVKAQDRASEEGEGVQVRRAAGARCRAAEGSAQRAASAWSLWLLALRSRSHQPSPHSSNRVQLLLKLPDGSAVTKPFKMGHTVAFVKLEIEKEYGEHLAAPDRQQPQMLLLLAWRWSQLGEETSSAGQLPPAAAPKRLHPAAPRTAPRPADGQAAAGARGRRRQAAPRYPVLGRLPGHQGGRGQHDQRHAGAVGAARLGQRRGEQCKFSTGRRPTRLLCSGGEAASLLVWVQ